MSVKIKRLLVIYTAAALVCLGALARTAGSLLGNRLGVAILCLMDVPSGALRPNLKSRENKA